MAKLIVTLDEINLASHNELIGGKAMNLIKMKKRGFNVPHAFIITTAAMGKMDRQMKDLIFKNLKSLKTDKVAVRSSATCEDTETASFAGQFESCLSVSKENLIRAIKKCWASISGERVLAYCQYKNISVSDIKMAVIVQEMIFAEKGGVIFTENVFQNNKDILMIEAAKGLGEKVVSGLVNPERILIDKKTRAILEKQSADGEVLAQKEIKELTDIALKIEELYRSSQDIEWAIMKKKIYILQSRPITK